MDHDHEGSWAACHLQGAQQRLRAQEAYVAAKRAGGEVFEKVLDDAARATINLAGAAK
jgi:hypothetical protein